MLPVRGLLVSGQSLAGVHLGDTPKTVRATWGHNFTRCDGCKPATWFYFYPTGDRVGAAVAFREGRVASVFTLGMKRGWRNEDGLKVGGLLTTKQMHDGREWEMCAGYCAKQLESSDDAITSVLTQGPIIYGFALTRPSEPVCH